MNHVELIGVLEEECRRINADAQRRIHELQRGISVLRGELPLPDTRRAVEHDRKPRDQSVTSRLVAIAEALAAQGKAAFDQAQLKAQGATMFPAEAEKINRGVYVGVVSLIQKGFFIRVPGGFALAPEVQRNAMNGANGTNGVEQSATGNRPSAIPA